MWQDGSWNWTEAKGFHLKEITVPGWTRNRSDWLRRKKKNRSDKRPSNKSLNGYSRIPKAGVQRARLVSINMRKCFQKSMTSAGMTWRSLFLPVPDLEIRS